MVFFTRRQSSDDVGASLLGRCTPEQKAWEAAGVVMLLVLLFAFLEAGKPAQAIVGGDAVPGNPNPYPFMVALLDTTRKPPPPPLSNQFHCGGTLIDKDTVLTAAHCKLTDKKNLRVIIGATELVAGQGQERGAAEFWTHPLYTKDPNATDWQYDVAVIKLNQPVTDPKIEPIQLATPDDNDLEQRWRNATVAGWGFTKPCPKDAQGKADCKALPAKERQQTKLRQVQVPLWGDQEAQTRFFGQAAYSPDLMVAAGGQKDQGACLGDSGGPLFAKKNGRYTQIGVASFAQCKETKGFFIPDVYTEVNAPSIRRFIINHARK